MVEPAWSIGRAALLKPKMASKRLSHLHGNHSNFLRAALKPGPLGRSFPYSLKTPSNICPVSRRNPDATPSRFPGALRPI